MFSPIFTAITKLAQKFNISKNILIKEYVEDSLNKTGIFKGRIGCCSVLRSDGTCFGNAPEMDCSIVSYIQHPVENKNILVQFQFENIHKRVFKCVRNYKNKWIKNTDSLDELDIDFHLGIEKMIVQKGIYASKKLLKKLERNPDMTVKHLAYDFFDSNGNISKEPVLIGGMVIEKDYEGDENLISRYEEIVNRRSLKYGVLHIIIPATEIIQNIEILEQMLNFILINK